MRWAEAVAMVVLVTSGVARADGAFPADLQLFEPLDVPARTVLATNYGLILTEDQGQHWSYVCEQAISGQQVTRYALGADGTLYAASGSSVLHSTDHGCTWSGTALGAQADQVSDLFADPVDPGRIYALAYRGATFELMVSSDRGQTFTPGPLSGTLLLGIEPARTRPQRVYGAGFTSLDGGALGPVLFTSDDRASTFAATPLTNVGNVYPFIAAVDPADPDTVFMNLTEAGKVDRLAVTHDRGQAVRVLLDAPTNFSAFAVGPDHVAYVADLSHHLWRIAPDAGVTPLSGPSAPCLATRAGNLDACGSLNADPYVLGRSTDQGQSFSPLVTSKSYSTLDCPAVLQICGQVNSNPVPASAGSSGGSGGQTKHGCGCTQGEGATLAWLVTLGLAFGKAWCRRRPSSSPRPTGTRFRGRR